MRDKRGLEEFTSDRGRWGSFYEVFRKPNYNDPHRAHVSLGGMIVAALIFAVGVVALLYLFEAIGFENPDPSYYEADKPYYELREP